jgi:two-component system response regulator PilR (NtrC family)
LENILERAMAMCEGEVIEPGDLHLPRTTITSAVAASSVSTNLNGYLQDQEKELILDALEKTKWNRIAAAQLLGVSFRTLRYRLKKLGLD